MQASEIWTCTTIGTGSIKWSTTSTPLTGESSIQLFYSSHLLFLLSKLNWLLCFATHCQSPPAFLLHSYLHSQSNRYCIRYVRAWCWGSNCGVRPRCCKPRNKGQKLQCKAGTKAIGARDTWGPVSTCDDGWMPMTHQRIDLLDQRHPHNEVMHKYECNEKGCRAYCWGSACQTWAKCCRIVAQ